MATQTLLTFDTIGMAYRFLEEAEDENPAAWGVDLFPAYPKRGGDGVYRARESHPDPFEWIDERWRSFEPDFEDKLIARLDGELDEDDDEDVWADAPTQIVDQDAGDDGPQVPALAAEDDNDVEGDATEVLPTREGYGRTPRVARAVSVNAVRKVAAKPAR